MSELPVSVVVPTRGRPDLLARCLDALLAQDFPPSEFEIVVADDGSDDVTRRVVCDRAGSGAAVRYLAAGHGCGPAHARNVAWRAAHGRVIAFTDDDCMPRPGWLAAGLAAIKRGAAGVSGRIIVPLPESPTDYERDAAGLQHAMFATANCFYRRDALELAGGFDERFRLAWREDADLYLTLAERGLPLASAPHAIVIHPVRRAPWGISLQQQRKSLYNALLYRKHPRLYRERIQPQPPLAYYRTVGALLTFAAGLCLRNRRLALLGAGWWLWLTGAFFLRRLRGNSLRPAHVLEMLVTSAIIPPLAVYWRLRGALRYRVIFL